MRPTRSFSVLLALAALLTIAGCTAHSPTATKANGNAAQAAAPGSGPGSAVTPGKPSTPPVKVAPVAPKTRPVAATPAWPTGPRVNHETYSGAQLVAVRTGAHDTYDRVVFEFTGKTPSYDVRYVPRVISDGSGLPVALRGGAFLAVVFPGASDVVFGSPTPPGYHLTYTGPRTITPGLGALEQVKVLGTLEQYLSLGIGVDHKAGFRVFELDSPSRIVIDVAH